MGGASGRASKHRRIPRHLLNPSPFAFDRLLAILNTILPDPLPQTADVQTQIATLTSLRLLLRVGASGDPLDPACKWRVNFGWDYVQAVGRSVAFEISEWVAGGTE
jgi:origin recognition complex subunit 5